ncbi:tetratricopeptide repeat protein [Silvibacterium acidisoli]|uniref:tetratricopeptide repeat protein n=1 Tax=Acidobacteriaceae bacterium ZG23-2 TaxID=2883246 RepID=UPI00406BED43
MNRFVRFPVMATATISLLVLMTGCQKLRARDQLNKGVQAYKSAKYEEAINHFQQAVNDDPTLPMAKSYLATAYANMVVPDLQTPDNLKNAKLAMDGFQQVLNEDPKDVNSMKNIASLYFNIGKYDDAKTWQKKVLDADPQDAEAAYTIGSIDWRLAYRQAVQALKDVGMQDDGQGNVKMPKKACQDLITKNGPLVDEGLQYLHKAVEIRPNYDDAMAYLQLTYRRKADLECGNDDARKADMAQVDEWREKAMNTRKANEEKKNSQVNGVVMK